MADPIYRQVPVGLQPDRDGRVVKPVSDQYAGIGGPGNAGAGLRYDLPTLGNPSYGPAQRSVTSPTTGNGGRGVGSFPQNLPRVGGKG